MSSATPRPNALMGDMSDDVLKCFLQKTFSLAGQGDLAAVPRLSTVAELAREHQRREDIIAHGAIQMLRDSFFEAMGSLHVSAQMHEEVASRDEDIVRVILICLLHIARNLCAAGKNVGLALKECAFDDLVVLLLADICSLSAKSGWVNGKYCRRAVQVLSNMASTSSEVAASVWFKVFPSTLTELAELNIGEGPSQPISWFGIVRAYLAEDLSRPC
eukprot:jgi/Botrbrau1/17630/Bobra.0166s0061.1